jgi:ribosome-binding protein aMBF1 (putative translation factor)
MNANKKKKLEAAGWKVGSTSDFLDLSAQENAIIELKLALSKAIRLKRQAANLTQAEFAKKLRSSQSRVAKMEAGDASVSLDLLIYSLYGLGVDNRKLSKIIAG